MLSKNVLVKIWAKARHWRLLHESEIIMICFETVKLSKIVFSISASYTLKFFFKHFEFCTPEILNHFFFQIKDFPESKLFSNIAPDQYVNLYEIMPFLDYTHINREESGRGRLNLLNLFNDKHERPDPGPKVYIGYGKL